MQSSDADEKTSYRVAPWARYDDIGDDRQAVSLLFEEHPPATCCRVYLFASLLANYLLFVATRRTEALS